MNNDIAVSMISADEIFKLIGYRASVKFADTAAEERKKYSFFSEGVTLLTDVERFVFDVWNGLVPTEDEYKKAEENGDLTELRRICNYFNKLRYPKEVLENPFLGLSENLNIVNNFYTNTPVRRHLRQLAKLLDEQPNSDKHKSDNENFFILEGDVGLLNAEWHPKSFPAAECFRLVASLRRQLEINHKKIQQTQEEQKQLVRLAYQRLDSLLHNYASVFTLALDIRFIHGYEIRGQDQFAQFLEKILVKRSAILNVFQRLPGLLQLYCKMEHDFQWGINLHCIFIFQNKGSLTEAGVIAHVESMLGGCFLERSMIEIRNRNALIRTHCSKSAVGVIRNTNTIQVQKFKYWLLGYFYLVDNYLKLVYEEKQGSGLEINSFWSKPWQEAHIAIANNAVNSALPKPYRLFHQVVTERDESSIWAIRHLPKNSIERIKLAQLHYAALLSGHSDVVKLIEVLMHIEILVETLLHSTTLPFNLPAFQGVPILTERELVACVTRPARQLLSLAKHSGLLASLMSQPLLLRHVSIQVNTFLFSQLPMTIYDKHKLFG